MTWPSPSTMKIPSRMTSSRNVVEPASYPWRRAPLSGFGGRSRGDVAAAGARAILLRAVELLVGARHRVLTIVGDLLDALVQLGAALGAVPREAIAFVRAPLAFELQDERVRREARRVRRARRTIDDLALADHRDLLVALGRPVVEVHVALDHVHDFVARIAVKLAAKLATTRDEGDAVGRLPQDRVGATRVADAAHDLAQIDGFHLVHGYSFVTFSTRRSKPLGCRWKPFTLARVATTWTSWSTKSHGASSTMRRCALR